MKLIIDISEEDYKECKFRKDLLSLGGEPTDLTFNMRMETLIANGTLLSEELEKIKSKMEVRVKHNNDLENYDIATGLSMALGILDNHISELKGESNDK